VAFQREDSYSLHLYSFSYQQRESDLWHQTSTLNDHAPRSYPFHSYKHLKLPLVGSDSRDDGTYWSWGMSRILLYLSNTTRGTSSPSFPWETWYAKCHQQATQQSRRATASKAHPPHPFPPSQVSSVYRLQDAMVRKCHAGVFFLVLSPLIDKPFRLTTYDCVLTK
jgi:hypothetical protein